MRTEKTERVCLCIDLKSFYASVECVERGLDPMTTNLVVADPERTEKTICLAVSPSLRAQGVKSRCRVFEIPPHLDYIMAPPRMQKYIDYAAEIYGIYLSFVSTEDVYVYSIDEAFLDLTNYLELYRMSAKEIAMRIMEEIWQRVGVRATCGIGTNLYLAKVALDITAKHSPDFIGILDESSFRELLWDHRPLTDFWRIGPGIANRLAGAGIMTMRDIAGAPKEQLYTMFGIDAELLIDHAYGIEPTTIADIKTYKAKSNCLTNGQVLPRDYSFAEGRLVVKEMVDLLCLEMAAKGVVTGSVSLYVGYSNALKMEGARGTASLAVETNADSVIIPAVTTLYHRIVNPLYPVRRINLTCNHIVEDQGIYQMNLFEDVGEIERNKKMQKAVLEIKGKYGKNAILKGMNLEEAATTRERNRQIGGHRSGEE